MASTDAKTIPQKNVALRITFPIFDADGDLVTGATGLDSEVSKDGGTFADCTNEATEIATASGMYYLDLTSTEMNADTVAVIVKTSSVGAKTTPIVLYTAARSINDLAWPTTTGRSIDVDASGGVEVGSFQANAITAAAIATDAIDDDAIATGAIASTAFAAGAINAAAIASDAITAAKIADGAIDSATFAAGAINAAAIATDAITAAKIAADAIGASELAADAVTEIQSGLATAAGVTSVGNAVATVGGYVDTEIGAIQSAIAALPTLATIADAVWDEALSGHVAVGTAGQAQLMPGGTAQAGAAGTITLAAASSASDDYYNGMVVVIIGGTGAGQARRIADYTGSTRVVATDGNWATNPDSTSKYVVLAG